MKNLEKSGRILIIDDNEDLLKAAKIFLKRHFLHIVTETNPELLPGLLQNDFDIILLDMNFTKDVASGKEGFDWLSKILEIDQSAVVVLMTAYGDVQTAVNAIKLGATNFILKPWNNEKFLATMYSSMKLKKSKLEVIDLRLKQKVINSQVNEKYKEIIGNSPAMIEVFDLIDRVAKTDANVLILGENGTGKELIASAIHNNSTRNEESLVSVDLGSISESLFESELFGHKKGAFTDAKEDRAGRFEAASTGTLFLDEIGNLTLSLQTKLLSVLQSRKVRRVGANKEIDVDIRLICATNMPLHVMVENNEFRQDLLYRINTIEINLPPLRKRTEDIVLLAEHFLKIYARKYNPIVKHISLAAINKLKAHSWPGNIRELQHSLERAVIMTNSDRLEANSFMFTTKSEQSGEGIEGNIGNLKLHEIEKLLIQKTLEKYDGNITKVSSELGLTRTSLYRRIKKYGL